MRIMATFKGVFGLFFVFLSACALPDKPIQAVTYDFGPGQVATAPAPSNTKPSVVALADIETHAALDGNALLYRLAYADAQQLRPYAQARWSMAPAQLLRQRLREHLGQHSVVLNPGEATAQNARLLRIELEEFSQIFDSPGSSSGLVRLRATVVQPGPQGERLLGQHTVVVQRPAPSPDAAGAVRALTAATDAAVLQLDQWLQSLP
jgi:cholesterol transport system auxiliary component